MRNALQQTLWNRETLDPHLRHPVHRLSLASPHNAQCISAVCLPFPLPSPSMHTAADLQFQVQFNLLSTNKIISYRKQQRWVTREQTTTLDVFPFRQVPAGVACERTSDLVSVSNLAVAPNQHLIEPQLPQHHEERSSDT